MFNAGGSQLGRLFTALAFSLYMAVSGWAGSTRVVAVVRGAPVTYGEIRADARAVSDSLRERPEARPTLGTALARARELESVRLESRILALAGTAPLEPGDVAIRDRRYQAVLARLPSAQGAHGS